MESTLAAIPKIFEQIDANPDAREAFVFAAWKQTVGELLNEHTVPVELAGSKLCVAVENLTWQRHLEDMAGQILAKLNSLLGRSPVKFIQFYVDEKMVAANRSTRHPAVREMPIETDGKIAMALRDSAASIGDEEMRKAFLLAAESCLARKERMSKTS